MTDLKGLSELVLEEKLAGADVVAAAEQQAQSEGLHLALALTEAGRVPEMALVAALRRRLRLPLVEVSSESVDPEAISAVPREVALRHLILPLEVKRQAGRLILRAALADPLDNEAIADVEYVAHCRLELVIAPPSAIVEALSYHYRGSPTKVIRQNPAASEPARVPGIDPGHPGLKTDPGVTRTAPYHRIEDEAPLELRLRALLDLLIAREIIDEDDYLEEIRRLMKERAGIK